MCKKCLDCPYNYNGFCTKEETYIEDIKISLYDCYDYYDEYEEEYDINIYE